MVWTKEDEQLYEALALDEQLSAGVRPPQIHVPMPIRPNEVAYLSARCSLISLTMRQRGVEFWHYTPRQKKRVIGDPLGAGCMWILIWGPINIILFVIHVFQWLFDPPRLYRRALQSGEFFVTDQRILFNMTPYHYYELDYALLEEIAFVSEGVRISYQSNDLLMMTDSGVAQLIYVLLTNLVSSARRGPGLAVPEGFITNAQLVGRALEPDRITTNGPKTWRAQAYRIRGPIPIRSIIGGFVLLIILVNILF
jgi:hypothetical protein